MADTKPVCSGYAVNISKRSMRGMLRQTYRADCSECGATFAYYGSGRLHRHLAMSADDRLRQDKGGRWEREWVHG